MKLSVPEQGNINNIQSAPSGKDSTLNPASSEGPRGNEISKEELYASPCPSSNQGTILFSRDGWFDPSRTKTIQTPTSKFVLVSSRGRDCSSTLTSTNGTDKRGPQEAGRKESPANSRFEDDMLL